MKKDTYILGISGGFAPGNQDGAAVLIKNPARPAGRSEIIAAVEEERLKKIKHARGLFPERAIEFCLEYAGISIQDVEYLAFHVNTYKDAQDEIKRFMEFRFGYCPEIKFVDHHNAHAASAYFVSGFDEAKVITMDYSGDGISTTLSRGKGNSIKRLKEYKKPNSLGIFYAQLTQFLGFEMDSDEYKVMGLSAYGKEDSGLAEKMAQILKVEECGYELDPKFLLNTQSRQQPRFSDELNRLLGPQRKKGEPVTKRHKNIAYAAQKQFEKACLSLLKDISSMVDSKNVCLAGGSALNAVMNSVLLQSEYADHVYVTPVAGDSGASLGAALVVANGLGFSFTKLQTPFLGPEFTNDEIKNTLDVLQLQYRYIGDEELFEYVAKNILKDKIVGWFQGRLEFGARALGNRSILANPASPIMRDTINKKIKFRESFRPFAPSVIEEKAYEYFENAAPSPYMTFTFDVKTEKLPAVTHVDGSARVHTVSKEQNPRYYALLKKLEEKSGIPIVLNTSLNIMDQPIVCAPRDAVTVFAATGMDMMVLGNYVLEK